MIDERTTQRVSRKRRIAESDPYNVETSDECAAIRGGRRGGGRTRFNVSLLIFAYTSSTRILSSCWLCTVVSYNANIISTKFISGDEFFNDQYFANILLIKFYNLLCSLNLTRNMLQTS